MPTMPNQSNPKPNGTLLKRLKKAAPNLTLALQDKNKSRTNISFTNRSQDHYDGFLYDGSLEESRRATIALTLMIAGLREEAHSPGGTAHGAKNGKTGYL